jgi:hypothetical protein
MFFGGGIAYPLSSYIFYGLCHEPQMIILLSLLMHKIDYSFLCSLIISMNGSFVCNVVLMERNECTEF